jgi:hypothetical protein
MQPLFFKKTQAFAKIQIETQLGPIAANILAVFLLKKQQDNAKSGKMDRRKSPNDLLLKKLVSRMV